MPLHASPVREAQHQRRLWTPAAILPNVQAWYEYMDASTLTVDGSGNISECRDKAGKVNATQATSGNRPPFTSGNEFTKGRSAHRYTSLTGIRGLACASAVTTSRLYIVAQWGAGTQTTFSGFAGLITGDGANSAPRITGNNGGSGWLAATLATTWFRNGSKTATGTALPMPMTVGRFDFASTTEDFGIGMSKITANRSWNGIIMAALFTDGAEGADNINRIEGYLAHQAGVRLVAGHPYARTPPLIGR